MLIKPFRVFLMAFPVLTLSALALSSTFPTASSEEQAALQINQNSIRAHVQFLADDLLEGRAPGTRGSQLAMKYIAAQFEALGLQPGAADGTYFQPFSIVGITSDVPPTLTLRRGTQELQLNFWDDFIALSGLQAPEARADNAEVIFVGYGIVAPEYQWDDYKGVDVKGKVLLMMNNDPAGDPKLFAGKTRLYYGRWTYKYEIAAQKGAAGAIIIHTRESAGYPYQVVQSSFTGEQFELPAEDEPRLPIKMWGTDDACKRIAQLAGKDLDELRRRAERRNFKPVPLGVTMSLTLKNTLRQLETANVLGLLPGSDPVLKKEVVVYTAHHDHFGIGKPVQGDSIYNGALDNASGVATMLTFAHAFSELEPKPRRSILFAAVGGEESGLLGSKYYALHPTFKPGNIAACLNVDGINIWGRTRDITIIGYGKSTLDRVLEDVARLQGRVVKGDQFPDRGFYYRSDQFNFAKIGVPAIFFDTGLDFVGRPPGWGKEQVEAWENTHYHQPSDQYESTWDLSGAVEDARLEFLVGLRVANADQMPQWHPGDEFEAARLKALKER